jgi:hypothetical protein
MCVNDPYWRRPSHSDVDFRRPFQTSEDGPLPHVANTTRHAHVEGTMRYGHRDA